MPEPDEETVFVSKYFELEEIISSNKNIKLHILKIDENVCGNYSLCPVLGGGGGGREG